MGNKVIDEPSLRNRMHVFKDRLHAGELLAKKLSEYRGTDAYVIGIPAGGVPVGYVIAKRLGLAFDIAITRKIHIPWNKEAGFGAITWNGTTLLNQALVDTLGLSKEEIEWCIAEEGEAIKKRLKMFRGDNSFPDIKGKTIILIDDGLASGFTMLATIKSIKQREPKEIIVAIPTASPDALERVKPHADKVICLNIRTGPIFAVADAYKLWYDLEDEEVIDILKRAGLKSARKEN